MIAHRLEKLVHDRDFPDTAIDEIAAMQAAVDNMLGEGERELDRHRGSITRKAAYRLVVELVTTTNLFVISKHIRNLSPQVSAAMDTFRDFLANTVRDVAAWVDLHATDPRLRERAAEMRTRLAELTSQAA